MNVKYLLLALAVGLTAPRFAHAANLLTSSSAAATSLSADGSSFGPILSDDGRRLFFFSRAANLTSNQPLSDSLQLFVRDLVASNTARVNILSNRWPSDADVTTFSASSNGQFIVFASEANHPALGDTNFASDIFVHDVESNITRLVSRDWVGNPLVNPAPASTNPLTANPIVSADGRWVFFESIATTLTYEGPSDNNNAVDVFRRDLQHNRTTLVSRRLSIWPEAANAGSKLASITPDGQYVAFLSSATDLVFEPSSGQEHVYVRDMVSSNTVRVTAELTNYFSPYRFTNVRLSDNGRFVLFAVEDYGWMDAIYLRDLQTSAAMLIATNDWWIGDRPLSPLTAPQLSADGRFVLYQIGGTNIYRFDTTTATNELVTVELDQMPFINGGARDGVMTPDGNFILFNGNSPDFTTNNVTGWHLYARDMAAGTTRLVTLAQNGQPSANQRLPVLFSATPDLSRIAFDSTATDLVPSDENRASDVFLHEPSSGSTTLVSRRAGASRQTGSGHAFIKSDCISADGRYVVFTSYDNDWFAGDTNGRPDVFIRDLETGTLVTPGFSTNAARSPTISPNGRYVAYLRRHARYSYETTGGAIFRFDRQTGTDELVSSNSSSLGPSISGDGNLIAFLSNNVLVVRDMLAATNHVIGAAQSSSGRDATFTPDGTRVLFISSAALTPNASGSLRNLYAWDFAQRQIRLLSHDGTQELGFSRSFVVSGNSRYVVFNGNGWFSGLHLHDLIAGTNTVLRYGAITPAINADGSLVACVTLDFSIRLLLLNTTNGTEVGVATNYQSNYYFNTPLLSPDGRLLVYGERRYTGDMGQIPNGQYIYFTTYRFPLVARDLWFGTNLLISRSLSGTNANAPAWTAALARDGRTVVFHSAASDLVAGDYNDKFDVFAYKLGGGDSEPDGLDDDWEVTYFGNLSRNGNGDFDDDGSSDRDEFFAGTDPTNEGSAFRVITITSVSNNGRRIIWTGDPRLAYRVEYKEDLGSAMWHVLENSVSWDGSTASTIDWGNSLKRFYRVVRVP